MPQTTCVDCGHAYLAKRGDAGVNTDFDSGASTSWFCARVTDWTTNSASGYQNICSVNIENGSTGTQSGYVQIYYDVTADEIRCYVGEGFTTQDFLIRSGAPTGWFRIAIACAGGLTDPVILRYIFEDQSSVTSVTVSDVSGDTNKGGRLRQFIVGGANFGSDEEGHNVRVAQVGIFKTALSASDVLTQRASETPSFTGSNLMSWYDWSDWAGDPWNDVGATYGAAGTFDLQEFDTTEGSTVSDVPSAWAAVDPTDITDKGAFPFRSAWTLRRRLRGQTLADRLIQISTLDSLDEPVFTDWLFESGLSANNVTAGAPTAGSPTLTQAHALTASNATAGAPTAGSPTLTQAHALTANNATAGIPVAQSPTVSAPVLVTASNATAGNPEAVSPALTQAHALTASNVAAGEPVAQSPALTQAHALTANNATAGVPVAGSPSLTQAHALSASGATAGEPVAQSPALTQAHALTASGAASGDPVAEQAQLSSNGQLIASNATAGDPSAGSPTLTQTHALAASSATAGVPVVGSLALTQTHILTASPVAAGIPTVEQATLVQTYLLAALSVSFGAPVVERAAFPAGGVIAYSPTTSLGPSVSSASTYLGPSVDSSGTYLGALVETPDTQVGS